MLLEREFAEVIFRDAPRKIFNVLLLNDNIHLSEIAKQSDVTYQHLVPFLRYLEDKNLVKIDKSGRCCYVSSTVKGKKMLETFKLQHL